MKNETNYSHPKPAYTSRSEVMEAANQNREFFNSFSEALSHSWKFYTS